MKHAVSNRKPNAKARPLSGKSVLKNPSKVVPTGTKKSKVISSQNTKTKSVKKIAAIKSVQSVKLPVKKSAAVKPLKAAKTKIIETPKLKVQKAKTEKINTVKVAAKKIQPAVPRQNIKAEAAKIKAVAAAKTIKPAHRKLKLTAAVTKIKIAAAKKPLTALKNSAKAEPKKIQLVGSAKKTNIKLAKSKNTAPIVKAKLADKKIKAVNRIKKSNVKTVGKISQPKSVGTIKKVKVAANKLKPKNLQIVQTSKKTISKPIVSVKKNKNKVEVKTKIPKAAPAVHIKKPKIVKNKVQETKAARPVKPKNKKAKPISSAVFRGKKNRYDFKVFALNETFEAIPAVYIISKRKIDRLKKGHHALICIGATDSIFDEIKKHRKGKCVKKHQANVVSILPEANEKIRLKIETDLKAAHSVACHLD